ncbi:MAG: glycine cleavage system protein H [Chitinophagaceae bacterium]
MNSGKTTNKDLYYTKDHEWINFQGTVAYTGICHFKLLGFKEIHQIRFKEPSGFKKKGEVIATITYKDYQIEAHMPVDGKVIEVNEALLSGNRSGLLQHAENSGWLALIVPSQPYERKDLLLPKQYQMNGKGKYAK